MPSGIILFGTRAFRREVLSVPSEEGTGKEFG